MPIKTVNIPEFHSPTVVSEGELTVLTTCNRQSPLIAVVKGKVETLDPPFVPQHIALSGSTLYLGGLEGVAWSSRHAEGWSPWSSFNYPEFKQLAAMAVAGDLCVLQDFKNHVQVYRRGEGHWTLAWERALPQIAAIQTDGRRVAVATRLAFPAPRETHTNELLLLAFEAAGAPTESRIELPLTRFPTSLALLEGAVVFGDDGESTDEMDSGAVFRCDQLDSAWVLSGPIKLPGARKGERFGTQVQRVSATRFAATTKDSGGTKRLGLFELGQQAPLLVSRRSTAVALQVGGDSLVEVGSSKVKRTELLLD